MHLKRFFHDEKGSNAIEYALIAAAFGLVLIAILPWISRKMRIIYKDIIQSRVINGIIN